MPRLISRTFAVGCVTLLAACATAPKTAVKNTSKTFSTVVVDAGHGGEDNRAYRRFRPPGKMATIDGAGRVRPKPRETALIKVHYTSFVGFYSVAMRGA